MKYEYEIIKHNRFEDISVSIIDLSYQHLHAHREFEIIFVLSGRIKVNTFKEQTYFEKDSFILFNPSHPHDIQTVDDSWAKIISLQILPSFCARFFPSFGEIEFSEIDILKSMPPQTVIKLKETFLNMCDVYFNDNQFYEFLFFSQINLLFHYLINAAPWYTTKEYKSAITRLNRILNCIESNYMEKITLRDIAQLEGLSISFISHYLFKCLGMSFRDYVCLLRFREAKKLLSRTKMSITDVYMASGFSDYRYMHNVFMEKLGCTPKEYRLNNSIDVYNELNTQSSAQQRLLNNQECSELIKSHKA